MSDPRISTVLRQAARLTARPGATTIQLNFGFRYAFFQENSWFSLLSANIVRHDYCCGVCRAYLDLGSLSLEVKRDLPCPSVKSKAR